MGSTTMSISNSKRGLNTKAYGIVHPCVWDELVRANELKHRQYKLRKRRQQKQFKDSK